MSNNDLIELLRIGAAVAIFGAIFWLMDRLF